MSELQAVMDAITALERVKVKLEKRGRVKPIVYHDGPTDLFFCGNCRGAVAYGDHYCRMCGAEINWG